MSDERSTSDVLVDRIIEWDVDTNDDRSFLSQAQQGMTQWWELMAARGTSTEPR